MHVFKRPAVPTELNRNMKHMGKKGNKKQVPNPIKRALHALYHAIELSTLYQETLLSHFLTKNGHKAQNENSLSDKDTIHLLPIGIHQREEADALWVDWRGIVGSYCGGRMAPSWFSLGVTNGDSAALERAAIQYRLCPVQYIIQVHKKRAMLSQISTMLMADQKELT